MGGRGRVIARGVGGGVTMATLLVTWVVLAAPNGPAAPSPWPVAPRGGGSIVEDARRGRVAPPAIEDVEQVCALFTSCADLPVPPAMLPTDFAACVRTLSGQLSSPGAVGASLLIRECGLRSNSCAELRTCALRGASPSACAGRGKDNPAGYCDIDGRALSCFHEHVSAVRDCPRGGEQCAVKEGEAICSLGACPAALVEGAGAACSGSGTRIVQCEHGVLRSLDCAAFGLVCTSNGSSGAACASPTTACTGTATRCEGDASVSCYNGHEVRVDCGVAGMTCDANAVGSHVVGACVAPASSGPSCDPSAPARCEGSTLRYCGAGQPRSFPCKALGWNRCVNGSGGARCG